MTDKERLIELLESFGVTPLDVHSKDAGRIIAEHFETSGAVVLAADYGSVDGYNGFYCAFDFNSDGAFVNVGVWE